MADEVVIMRRGRIVQAGTPRAVYQAPADLETAALVGATVRLPGLVQGPLVDTCLGPLRVGNPGAFAERAVTVMLRPEQIVPAPAGDGFVVELRDTTFLGPLVWLDLVARHRGEAIALRACWPASHTTELGPTLRVMVRGLATVFPELDGAD